MYGKVFAEIFDSTLAAEGGWLPTYIFMSMVAIADKEGVVDVAPGALYRKLALSGYDDPRVTYQQFEKALEFLCSPDESSKSREADGRRIIPLSRLEAFDSNRGYLIVNYLSYRSKGGSEDRKRQSADRSKRYRSKQKTKTSAESSREKRDVGVTGCDKSRPLSVSVSESVLTTEDSLLDQFESIWIARPRRAGSDPKKSALSAYRARLKEGHTFAEIQAGYERYRAFCEATGKTGTEWVMRASTFLGPDDHFLNQWEIPKRDGKSKPSYAERCAAAARRHHHE